MITTKTDLDKVSTEIAELISAKELNKAQERWAEEIKYLKVFEASVLKDEIWRKTR